jgi:hypothetical protein
MDLMAFERFSGKQTRGKSPKTRYILLSKMVQAQNAGYSKL